MRILYDDKIRCL